MVYDAEGSELLIVTGPDFYTSIKPEPCIAYHQRIVVKSEILSRIGDDQWMILCNRMGAE